MSTEMDRVRFHTFIANVRQEILNMKSGESRFRAGALHFDKGEESSPALNRLRLFEENPTPKNLTEFLVLAKQDFGGRCADEFKLWSSAIFEPEAFNPPVPTVREFEIQVKDCVYDCFRSVSIPMSPKQIELLEKHTFKLANVFRAEISKGIGTQLEALVKRLKENEVKEEVKEEVKTEPIDIINV